MEKDYGKKERAEAVFDGIFWIGHERRWRDFAGRGRRKQMETEKGCTLRVIA